MTTKKQIQVNWLDYWFKLPVVKVSNQDFQAKLKQLADQGLLVHTVIVKQGGYELHTRQQ